MSIREESGHTAGKRHYSTNRVSPWVFIVIAAITVTAILAGVFQIDPLTRVVNWLAVVL